MILALDFDGVVADGLAECLLTAWNTWHGRSVTDFGKAAYATVPAPFKARFRHLRNFVRHDGHFLVAFLQGSEAIRRSDHFTQVYEETETALRSRFRADFARYRLAVQEQQLDNWLRLHTVEPDIVALLREQADTQEVHIVSGKDVTSVRLILQHHEVPLVPQRIHGRLSDKRLVLRSLATEATARGERLVFCDDNLDNVLEASELGIETAWALWGYHTPEHVERAQALGIQGMSSSDFVLHARAAAGDGRVQVMSNTASLTRSTGHGHG